MYIPINEYIILGILKLYSLSIGINIIMYDISMRYSNNKL